MSSTAKEVKSSMNSNNVVNNTYYKKLLRLSESGVSSDCEFLVGSENVVIKGHKLLFSVASDVFQAMFYGDFKEEKIVRVEDLDPDGFKGMKEFIYTGDVNFISSIHALTTFAAARKYIVSELVNKCTEYIEQKIHPSELLEFYEYCKVYNISEFEELCCKIIREKTDEVMESEYFIAAKADTIEFILQFPSLTVKSEVDVFKHFEKWALAEADRKKISAEEIASSFNNLKHHIRFLTITVDEFVSRVSQSLLLTSEEKLAIGINLMKFDSTTMPENLSLVQQNRHIIPSIAKTEKYKYSHTFTVSTEKSCSCDKYVVNFDLNGRVKYQFEIAFFKENNYILFHTKSNVIHQFLNTYWTGSDLLAVYTKLRVLAENECEDLIFENVCNVIVNGDHKPGPMVILAAIPISTLRHECFLRGVGNKTVTIVGSFDFELLAGNNLSEKRYSLT